MLHLRQRLMDRIAAHEFENLYFESLYLPMKLPPRPWLDHGTCGPLYSFAQKIIRDSFESKEIFMNEKFSKLLLKSDERSGMKRKARLVFDSLNNLGATPWIINKPMLAHILKIFGSSKDLDKKELLKSLKIPAHPSTIYVTSEKMNFETSFPGKTREEITEDEYQSYMVRQKKFDKEKQEATQKRNQLCSLHTWVLYRLAISRHFQNDLLYFPHNMDFRGRVYPISPFINHMGDDVNRGLLRFAKGKKLGSRGFEWLKIHCINLTGLKKRRGWWRKSDEPWQTLAACIEIRDAMKSGDPEQFVSHLPIHQDGSCNGLQHYAALGRDYEGAFECLRTS
uniref:DNA-directed RNA polymerase n=1 Tax=Ditylenchus dipsaci TaxID=166011 RepID=A0A915DH81_9BILA